MSSLNLTISKKILYVDDEAQALKYFHRLFGDRFDILTANSVDEAIKVLDQHAQEIGVVVTDQRMPEKTGVELLEVLRQRDHRIVRILTTAFSELDLAIQAVNEGGAFRYLTKPWNDEEMVGTLMRALEYHQAIVDRENLMQEKLSVLHRLIVMDRIRGLAVAATALEGRLHHAWPALVSYIQQSPVGQRIRLQMEEIVGLNMTAIARREAEMMVRTVEQILHDTIEAGEGTLKKVAPAQLIQQCLQQLSEESNNASMNLEFHAVDLPSEIECDAGLWQRLLQITVGRLAEMQDQPTRIDVSVSCANNFIDLSIKGDFGSMDNEQVASLFAAAIPLHKWPIGLDLDMLSGFMITHHLGGSLKVEPNLPVGPGFKISLPLQPPSDTQDTPIDPAWFDSVYESLEEWQNDLCED